jgi:coenzyme F420 biosynthesis associated uncharacterized protein
VTADTAAADAAARAWTGLGADLPPTRVRVVSRSGWVRANLTGLRGALDPLAERIAERSASPVRPLAAQALGVQVGALLGLLAGKVLGQYVLPLGGPGQAQLIVVGPNLLDLAGRYGDLADDIRRTVLLHELAHRLQFDGASWLGDHLRGLLTRYLDAARLDGGALLEALGRLPEVLRAVREDGTAQPLLHAVLNQEQRAVVDEAQALMSLLEGHGNATMYAAADRLVRDPERVRASLERRRSDLVSRLLTLVAGMELTRRQSQEGEVFVRAVVDQVGTRGLNRAFAGPSSLPTLDEIRSPERWLDRVGRGGGPAPGGERPAAT